METDIYERIKNLCAAKNISVKKMCESTGIVYSSYYSSQQSKRIPNSLDLMDMARFFNVSVDYLLTGKESFSLSEEVRNLAMSIDSMPEKYRFLFIKMTEAQISAILKYHSDSKVPF